MSSGDYKKLGELREIVYDHTASLADRMAAQKKYDELLDESMPDFKSFLERLRAKVNEPGTPS